MSSVVRVLAAVFTILAISFAVFWIKVRPSGYPFPLEITDLKGRTLDVMVRGRVQDQVYFVRTRDQKEYDIPISSLSTTDQIILRSMPEHWPERQWVENYVTNREKRISEISHQISLLEAELEADSYNNILTRSRKEEIDRLQNEIKELESDIKVYKLDATRNTAQR